MEPIPLQKLLPPSIKAILRFIQGHWWFSFIESFIITCLFLVRVAFPGIVGIPIMFGSELHSTMCLICWLIFFAWRPCHHPAYMPFYMIAAVPYGYLFGIWHRPPNLYNMTIAYIWMICHIHSGSNTTVARACCTWRTGTHLCKAKMLSRPMSQFGGCPGGMAAEFGKRLVPFDLHNPFLI